MEPAANDAETVETNGEVTSEVVPSYHRRTVQTLTGNLSHDGSYMQYMVYFGNMFEVTAKYKPPIVPVGRGAYGIVCAATNSETNEKVAIKKIMHAFNKIIDAKRTLREIRLLRHFANHENIVGIRDVILPRERHSYEDVYIAYELMDNDLYGVLRSDQALEAEHIQWLMYEIMRGLKYIHSANVIHRDLKPSNILLNNNCELKICDFGLARATSETELMSGYVVTRWYRAPEVLLSCAYTAAIDVWSVGCIFMEMMTRQPLFPGKDQLHQLRLLMELIGTPSEEDLGTLNENAQRYLWSLPFRPRQSFAEKFPSVHPLALDLVEKMLTFDPRQRITVKDALAHPYFGPMHNIDDELECAEPFNFDLEQHQLTVENIKELIYNEALAFNPETQQ